MGTCHKHFAFSLGHKLSFFVCFYVLFLSGEVKPWCVLFHGHTPVGNKLPTQKFAFCAGKPRANNEETGILTDWWMFRIKI